MIHATLSLLMLIPLMLSVDVTHLKLLCFIYWWWNFGTLRVGVWWHKMSWVVTFYYTLLLLLHSWLLSAAMKLCCLRRLSVHVKWQLLKRQRFIERERGTRERDTKHTLRLSYQWYTTYLYPVWKKRKEKKRSGKEQKEKETKGKKGKEGNTYVFFPISPMCFSLDTSTFHYTCCYCSVEHGISGRLSRDDF